jgi:hypothetical protein
MYFGKRMEGGFVWMDRSGMRWRHMKVEQVGSHG